jgi:signal transduction histidine kinase
MSRPPDRPGHRPTSDQEFHRLAALERADAALQAVIDAAGRLDRLDALIPEALRILRAAFGGDFAAHYDYGDDGLVYLRWCCDAGGVYPTADTPATAHLPGPHRATLARLTGGFRLPPEYLGGPPDRVVRPLTLSHRRGTAVPEFDAAALAMGLAVELICPLVVGGRAVGKLVVYRDGDGDYTAADLALAEALSRHLSLVVQARRLADEVRRQEVAAAVAAERERAAEERAGELARANDALRRITDRLGANDDLSEFLAAALGELCAAGGAVSAGLFVYEPAEHTLRKVAFVWGGRPQDLDADPRFAVWRAPVPADVTDCWARMLAGEVPVWTDIEAPPDDQWAFALRWHVEMGHRMIAAFPLRVGGRPVGFLRLGFATAVRPTAGKLEQCRVLAQQAALALQMSRTAARARTAAVAVEHERAARERLGELVAANRILVNSLDGFTVNPNPDEFLAKVLMQLTDVLGVPVVELWYARDLSGFVFPGPMYHAGRVWTPDETGHPMRETGYRIPTSYDLVDAVDHRRHILWDDIAGHPDVPEPMWRWYRDRFGVGKMINLPLVVGRKVIGAAVGFGPPGQRHTESQLELGHALATQLALALQLGELSERAKSAAVLAERARLARDIHDTLAQGFLGVLLHMETARRNLTADPGRALRAIDQAQALAQTNLNEARRSVGMLRAGAAGQGDLAVTLSMLVREAAEGGLPARFETALATCPVPAGVAEQVGRVTAEALQNARRHAGPTRVVVTLTRTDGAVRVSVVDDGCGFDPAADRPGRYGLVGMRERAAAVGAGLTFDTAPGRGTAVTLVWPGPGSRGGGT